MLGKKRFQARAEACAITKWNLNLKKGARHLRKYLAPISMVKMLTFYQKKSSDFSDAVKQKLEEMVVAHRVVTLDSNSTLPEAIKEGDLPVLSDGHQVWKSPEEINQYLEELHKDMLLSQSMQSDTCHLDPDNPKECL